MALDRPARTTWSFHTAGRLTFGDRAVDQLGPIARRYRWKRALVVTDPQLLAAGIVQRCTLPLQSTGVAFHLFQGGRPEPPLETAQLGAAEAKEFQPDVIVGVGGGSNLDLAKIIALLDTHGGRADDYFGFDQVPGPVKPLVCIPTTAGTGSEVSHAAVLTDTTARMKVSTLSQYLRPTIALVDPELTWSCPPRVTADSGIDALVHAIEALTATDFQAMPSAEEEVYAYEGRFPLAECLAEKAIGLIAHNLPTAVGEPNHREARSAMALAATLAGIAFSNSGVALVHALEYPLGGALHCTHGAGNGLLLPYVMQFNLPARRGTLARIARLMGDDVSTCDEEQAAQRAVDAVRRLCQEVGIPQQIRDLGGSERQLPEFAAKAFAIERLRQTNPRPADLDDLLAIYRAAW